MIENVKLCQVIAIDKGAKAEARSAISKLHHTNQKTALFSGQTRTFEPIDDANQLPAESVRVQKKVDDTIDSFVSSLSEQLDVQFTKDAGNTVAKANVTVNGRVIIENAPSTFLLALEKTLDDINTFFSELPELDPAEEWTYDTTAGLFRAAPRKTRSTRKEEQPVVLYDATDRHPAQTQLVQRDVLVGFWNQQRLSGAIDSDRKAEILRRISAIRKAVRSAREEANSTEISRYRGIGKDIFDFVLND